MATIIIVANWPSNRQSAWEILTKARAIENQAYVLACNRVGRDKHSQYAGGSAIIDPYGNVMSQVHENTEAIICGDIDMKLLTHFREKFPVLYEKDNYEIK